MTTVRIGARQVNNRQEVLDWLNDNIGSFLYKESVPTGFDFIGKDWKASWHQFGGGWFMDVTFTDPKYATIFALRWK